MLDNSYARYVPYVCSEIMVFKCKEIWAIVQISVHSLLLVVGSQLFEARQPTTNNQQQSIIRFHDIEKVN